MVLALNAKRTQLHFPQALIHLVLKMRKQEAPEHKLQRVLQELGVLKKPVDAAHGNVKKGLGGEEGPSRYRG